MKKNYFSRKIRQFRNLSKRVNHLILNGEWEKLSQETKNRFISKLNLLFRELSRLFSLTELKKILAAAAVFIGFPLAIQAQSFAPPRPNPFWLMPDSVSLAAPVFADIDHDADMDLFSGIYGGAIQYYENTGTIAVPAFAGFQQNPFGIVTPFDDYHIAFPALADIDNDGDIDLFIGDNSYDRAFGANFQFYENIGTVVVPSFDTKQTNPFGLEPGYMFVMPRFADIDNDGDLDLFAVEGYGTIKFYENTGNDSLASFAAPVENPFGLMPVYVMGSPEFADTDHDGDLDLYIGEYGGNIQFYENTGTVSEPVFAVPVANPFGLSPTNYYSFPAFADLDADGDQDLMVGEYYGTYQYFQNTEINIGIPEDTQSTLFELYPNPARDEVFIRLTDKNGDFPTEVSIVDLNGRMIKSMPINSDDLRLTTDDLMPGIYIVKMGRDDKVFTRRLVIK